MFTGGAISLSLLLSWPLLELHFAEEQCSAGTLVHAHLLIDCEPEDTEGFLVTEQRVQRVKVYQIYIHKDSIHVCDSKNSCELL